MMGLNKTIMTKKMLGENVERYLKSDAHWVPVPPCPYCDEELDGPTTNGLHDKCNEAFHEDIEEAFPDEEDSIG